MWETLRSEMTDSGIKTRKSYLVVAGPVAVDAVVGEHDNRAGTVSHLKMLVVRRAKERQTGRGGVSAGTA